MSRRDGFTLIETIAVLGVIVVLLGLLLPAVQRGRDAANRVACGNHLKQIGSAYHNFESANGCLPPSSRFVMNTPEALLGPQVLLLPYLEQSTLYNNALAACAVEFDVTKSPPHTTFHSPVRILTCPADTRLRTPHADPKNILGAYGSYVGIGSVFDRKWETGKRGLLGKTPGYALSEIGDGSSQTILMAERPPPADYSAGWRYPYYTFIGRTGPNSIINLGPVGYFHPMDCELIDHGFGPGRLENPCDRYHLWSLHAGGGNFLIGDGSVRFLTYRSRQLVHDMATVNGGEVVEFP